MRFKTSVCPVLWLVITVIMNSATAQYESNSLDTLATDAVQKFEQQIMEKLQQQHMKVIEKLANSIETLVHILSNLQGRQLEISNHPTNVMCDIQHHTSHGDQEQSFDNELRKLQKSTTKEVIEKLAALTTNVEQIADSNQNLRNITDDLLEDQREIQKQLTSVRDDLQSHRSHVEQEKANDNEFRKLQNSTNKSIESLQKITDNVMSNLSDVQKQLTNVENKLIQVSKDVIPSSCTMLNSTATNSYYIRPAEDVEPFLVFCDFEDNYNLGGGWTVFQRRINGTVDFYQNWTMYKNGFGDMNGEHWLGLEKLHLMTRWGRHEMLVVLEDHEGGSAYARYDGFQIGSEAEKYKLTVGNYSGTAGDSLSPHNGMKFTTFDQDNDENSSNCANYNNGAWWFNTCFRSHLNGKYLRKGEHLNTNHQGVIWAHWKGLNYSLKSSKMMLRRR